jgi:hypothetical protein
VPNLALGHANNNLDSSRNKHQSEYKCCQKQSSHPTRLEKVVRESYGPSKENKCVELKRPVELLSTPVEMDPAGDEE